MSTPSETAMNQVAAGLVDEVSNTTWNALASLIPVRAGSDTEGGGAAPFPSHPGPLAGFTRGAGAGSPRWGCR
jgi:hypothetical protein